MTLADSMFMYVKYSEVDVAYNLCSPYMRIHDKQCSHDNDVANFVFFISSVTWLMILNAHRQSLYVVLLEFVSLICALLLCSVIFVNIDCWFFFRHVITPFHSYLFLFSIQFISSPYDLLPLDALFPALFRSNFVTIFFFCHLFTCCLP